MRHFRFAVNAVNLCARVLLAASWFFLSSFVALLALPFRWKDPSMGYFFARVLTFIGPKIFGLSVRIVHRERMTDHQPCIYIANHQSNLDIFTMADLYPRRTVVIGKKELLKLPLFGLFLKGSGNIMINRSNLTNSIEGFDVAGRYIREKKISVWIFPEGTRNRGAAEMLPFKKGAFRLAVNAQIPIVPIVHQHLSRYFDARTATLFNGPKNEVVIEVLEAVPTTGLTIDDIPELMATIRAKMEAALKKPELAKA